MTLVTALTDVDVSGTERKRPCRRLLLVLERGARQIEVHLVLSDLLLLGWRKADREPEVIARQEWDAVVRILGHVPAQDGSPEVRETARVVRIDRERVQITSHRA